MSRLGCSTRKRQTQLARHAMRFEVLEGKAVRDHRCHSRRQLWITACPGNRLPQDQYAPHLRSSLSMSLRSKPSIFAYCLIASCRSRSRSRQARHARPPATCSCPAKEYGPSGSAVTGGLLPGTGRLQWDGTRPGPRCCDVVGTLDAAVREISERRGVAAGMRADMRHYAEQASTEAAG